MPGKPALPHILARPQMQPSLLPVCPEALCSLRCYRRRDSCRPAPARGLVRVFAVQCCVYQTRKIATSRQNSVEEKEGGEGVGAKKGAVITSWCREPGGERQR